MAAHISVPDFRREMRIEDDGPKLSARVTAIRLRLSVVLIVCSILLELVTLWLTARVDLFDRDLLLVPVPVASVFGVGILTSTGGLLLDAKLGAVRQWVFKTMLAVTALVCGLGYLFALPLKMLTSSSSVEPVVQKLLIEARSLPDGNMQCSKTSSELRPVSGLVSATEVCVQGAYEETGAWISWQGRGGDELAYSPDAARSLPVFQGMCAREIYGPWFAVTSAGSLGSCPTGYHYTGSA